MLDFPLISNSFIVKLSIKVSLVRIFVQDLDWYMLCTDGTNLMRESYCHVVVTNELVLLFFIWMKGFIKILFNKNVDIIFSAYYVFLE